MEMYRGNNPTAVDSQRRIVAALYSLMSETDFSRISIKDVCENADVSRQTFYTLFGTKENALRWYLELLFAGFKKSQNISKQDHSQKETSQNHGENRTNHDQEKDHDYRKLCVEAIDFLLDRRARIEPLVAADMSLLMVGAFESVMLDTADKSNVEPSDVAKEKQYEVAYFAGALVEMISMFIRTGRPDNEKNRAILRSLMQG